MKYIRNILTQTKLTLGKMNLCFIGKILILLSIILYFNGYRNSNYNLQIISMYVLIVGLLMMKGRSNFIFVTFLACFFVFLLNRALIDIFDGLKWYTFREPEYINTAISIIFIGLISLIIGFNLTKIIENRTVVNNLNLDESSKEKKFTKFKGMYKIYSNSIEKNKYNLFPILFVLFIFVYIASLTIEIDKVIFMQGRLYEDFFLYYTPTLPKIIISISKMFPYILCLLLSFLPNKRTTYFFLFLNTLKTIPILYLGQRGDFVTSLLFGFVYFMLRKMNKDNTEIWFSKKEKVLIVLSIPTLMILMVFINESRQGGSIGVDSLLGSIKMFFHKQGVTFDTHFYGVQKKNEILQLTGSRNYLFGDIINPLKFNSISRFIFNTPLIPTGNSAIKAIETNSYAHILAYTVHPKYLEGHGFGTSYLIESYHTYGFAGVIAVNSIIGSLLFSLEKWFYKSITARYITTLILTKIFYLPRNSFSSFFSFGIKIHFWILFIIILFLIYGSSMINGKCKSKISSSKLFKYINTFI